MRRRFVKRFQRILLPVLLLLLVPGIVAAAGPTIDPVVRLWQPTGMLVLDGRIFLGTNDGGVLVWSENDPETATRWLANSELSSAAITDLSWTGRHLWIATADGGMTRVTDPAGAPLFDLYVNSLRTSGVSAVAGTVIEDKERVWYGAVGEGLGEIIGDVPGALYTAAGDGMLSDDIRDLAVHDGTLFIATALGVSRFANGVFTDTNGGLTNTDTRVLTVGGGDLYLGGADDVFRWDATAESWVLLGAVVLPVQDMVVHAGDLYVLLERSGGPNRLYRWDGTAFVELARPAVRNTALAAGTELWVAGWEAAPGMVNNQTFPLIRARYEPGDTYTIWPTFEIPVQQPSGVAFGLDGTIWVSDNLARSFVNRDDTGSWRGVYETAATSADSSGLIDYGGNMQFLVAGTDGLIWTGQLGGGVLRHDPATWHTDPVVVDNSGLISPRVINGVAHPDGPVIFLFDSEDTPLGTPPYVLVQVLVDTEHWRNPDNWATPAVADVGGLRVEDALVTRRDIIWLAAQGSGGGVVRWDVNGPDAGPDDPLTWTDLTDDDWSVRIDDFEGTSFDPLAAKALALDASGTIWVGGNGLVGMDYDEVTKIDRTVGAFGARTLDEEGLITSTVIDVGVDRHGYVWAVTSAGLNRVRPVRGGYEFDAWFDVVTYSVIPDLGILYSPSRVSDLPGVSTAFARLVTDAAGQRVLLSSSRGVALIDVGDRVGGGAEDGGGLYLYPNPWHPGADPRLAVGGIPAGADEPLNVGIYTLEGQLVYQDEEVRLEQGFWSGSNRVGNPITTGMYVVRVRWRDNDIMRTLAVVR